MKKVFLFAAAVVAAMTINAEQITFSEVAAKGSLDGEIFADGDFSLTITDTDAAKLEIDANNCWFGDATDQVKFEYRLKTGGKSSAKNALTLTVPAAGKLYIYARTGSNSDATRTVVLTQDGKELYNNVVKEDDAIKVAGLDNKEPEKETNVYPAIVVDVEEGDIDVAYPVNAVNFYAFAFGAPAAPQAIDNVKDAVKAEKIYRDGQLIIRKNGVEYNALGAQL
ncbi:MAG: hypothetical protein IJ814_06480 [Paludibacteraceae bacterium]|nr:hypothetical protein [Paludibacteraceae bacterium]